MQRFTASQAHSLAVLSISTSADARRASLHPSILVTVNFRQLEPEGELVAASATIGCAA
jgi:hypothetical protein